MLKKLFFHEVSNLITKKEKDILAKVNFDKFDSLLKDIYEKANFTEYNKKVAIFNQRIDNYFATLIKDDSAVISQKNSELALVKLRYSKEVIDDLEKFSKYKLDRDAKTKSTTESKL